MGCPILATLTPAPTKINVVPDITGNCISFLVTLQCNTQYRLSQVELVGVSPVKTATMVDIVLVVANVTNVS